MTLFLELCQVCCVCVHIFQSKFNKLNDKLNFSEIFKISNIAHVFEFEIKNSLKGH